jgi:hypothetical protein
LESDEVWLIPREYPEAPYNVNYIASSEKYVYGQAMPDGNILAQFELHAPVFIKESPAFTLTPDRSLPFSTFGATPASLIGDEELVLMSGWASSQVVGGTSYAGIRVAEWDISGNAWNIETRVITSINGTSLVGKTTLNIYLSPTSRHVIVANLTGSTPVVGSYSLTILDDDTCSMSVV